MKFFHTRFLVGIIVLLIGISALLNVLGITDFNIRTIIFTYWPVFLIIWGVSNLSDYFGGHSEEGETRVIRSLGQLIAGLIFIVIGFLILGRNLNLIDVDMALFWRLFWPIIIIIFGISLIRGVAPAKGAKSHLAFMGGIDIGKKPFTLQSGTYFAFMGGIDMDLRSAEIPEGETVLDLTAVMGGIDIVVPSDLPVICEGTAILGGVEFLKEASGGIISTKKVEYLPEESSRRVRFVVRALMGGVDIQQRD